MATGAQLLDRMADISSRLGPIRGPLESVLTPLARSFWPRGVETTAEPTTSDACEVLGSEHVAPYYVSGAVGWASYEAIEAAFARQIRERLARGRGAKTSILPPDLVAAGPKLLIRDRDDPLQCAPAVGRVYPQRAWVGSLHPGFDSGMLYVVCGILNSAIGQVLYRRMSRSHNLRSHDLRKYLLQALPVPLLRYDEGSYARAVLHSYRLHCLYAAHSENSLSSEIVDDAIPNEDAHLLSELVRLYGFSPPDARALVEEVLPKGLRDVPGYQKKLLYRPQEALQEIRLLDREDNELYETLKSHRRNKILTEAEQHRLDRLQRLIEWEDRLNGPPPTSVASRTAGGVDTHEAAIKAADRFISDRLGQQYLATDARRISPSAWEVVVYYVPPRKLTVDQARSIPREWVSPGHHFAGILIVNAATGEVTEGARVSPHAISA